MKVGLFVADFPPDSGGGFTFEMEILEAVRTMLGRIGHDIVVLCPATAEARLKAFFSGTASVVPMKRHSGLRHAMNSLGSKSALFRSYWRRPSDIDKIAHVEGVEFIWFVSAGIYQTDLPYLTVVWDVQHRVTPWFPEMSSKGLWDSRELSHRWFLQRAAGIVVGTSIGGRQLTEFYQVSSDRLLRLPHPTPRFSIRDGDRLAASKVAATFGVSRPFFLYPAQLWPHKNHVNLIQALARAVDVGRDVDLVLVGSDKGIGNHLASIAVQHGVADHVYFLGFVSREDLVVLYKEAIALAYVSWCGPENLPPLEAFALGCPVIAADIPGSQEQLGEAALLVDPADPAKISDAMIRLMDDADLRARLVKRGYARASAWTAEDYVLGVARFLDQFSPIVRCWPVGRHG